MSHKIIKGREVSRPIRENIKHRSTALRKAGWITPVPGGVGPVTLSILMRNVIAAVEQQKTAYEKAMLN